MKIYYDNQVNEVKDFIKKITSNLTDDQISKIIESEELEKFLVANESTSLVWNEDLKNSNKDIKIAIDDIAKININSEDGDAEFAAYFVSIFRILKERQPQVNQQQQGQQQNNQQQQEPDELSEELKKKYNFAIDLGNNPQEKIKRFRVVNEANGGADGGDKIFTDELEKALYCTSNGKALHLDTTALKENLENKKVQEAWWGILSKLGLYWDRGINEIKITEPSKGQNNADMIGEKGLNRPAIKSAIEEKEKERKGKRSKIFEQIKLIKPQMQPSKHLDIYNDSFHSKSLNESSIDEFKDFGINNLNNINNINFNSIEIIKKIFTFDVKKYGSLFEIVAEDATGGSYRFQLDASVEQNSYNKEIYGLIKNKDVNYDFKADDDIQTKLNKLLEARNIEEWKFLSSNNAKKDALINKNPKAYSCSYYRDKDKNTDINVNFGFLQNEIKSQDDFEKLIYQQGAKSEFFVKVDDNNNAEKYVKFSLYWDEDKGKPAIHLAKSLNGNNIDLYGSNQELCGSVAKNDAQFKDIKVSFQLYYNRGKTSFQQDDNKALCFINDATIKSFFDSSKASDLDLNSSIVTTKEATKKINKKIEREFTQEEKNVEIAKIDSVLKEGLDIAFPAKNGVVNPLIAIITKFVKGDNDAVMPDEIKQDSDKKEVENLKNKYQVKLNLINGVPANQVNNPQNQHNQPNKQI